MRKSHGTPSQILFEEMLEWAKSLSQLGVLLWRGVLMQKDDAGSASSSSAAFTACRWWEKFSQDRRVPRVSRALFPLGSRWKSLLCDFPLNLSLEGLLEDERLCSKFSVYCWCELVVFFLNHLYNGSFGFGPPECSRAQMEFLNSIEGNVKRWLEDDCEISWKKSDVVHDFSKKMVSYNGVEICKAEPLSVYRVSPALPPEGHGGSIEIAPWVDGKSRWYLEHPRCCITPDAGQQLPKLQARVHIERGDEKALSNLLVEKNICCWVPEERVLEYRGQKVLNGLFGVPKPNKLLNHQCALRCIMNLIPSNSILRSIPGRIGRLPAITQWLRVCLGDGETLSLSQSDMVSAFYLFRLPPGWAELLCFNLSFLGEALGFEGELSKKRYYLGCQVLPMGWSSAVGLMQAVAESVLHNGGIPEVQQVIRGKPVPRWMIDVQNEAQATERVWWHVYLDNFACGERLKAGCAPEGGKLQQQVENLWSAAGIVSAKSKAVKDQRGGTELGAFIGGRGNWIGAGPERMFKLAKTTLWILQKPSINKKSLQILLGRWVFAMQFRRPFMSHFEAVWRLLGKDRRRRGEQGKVKEELLLGIMGMPLLQTWMGAKIDNETTCSDASLSGGAVAVSDTLSSNGEGYVAALEEKNKPTEIPVAVISLFNGIGGAARSYDVAGVRPRGYIIAECHKPANRVYNRRWPGAHVFLDVNDITRETLEAALMELEPLEEIHFWAGFPCVDLSSVRARRRNLAGKGSGLIFKALEVLEMVRELFPRIRIRFVFENVASMDNSAREEISELLGVIPYRLDPIKQAPMSRPRYCWTDVEIWQAEDMLLTHRGNYIEIEVKGEWPKPEDWLDEGTSLIYPDTIFPTCMKALRRFSPPEAPAGIERTPMMARSRWESDDYRFPPYQYKDRYLVWDGRLQCCRLINSLERERLMGYGSNHTSLAYSASVAKGNQLALEDERCSLIGDSFSIYSFMVIAAFAAAPWTKLVQISQMNTRVGLPPGLGLNLKIAWPLSQKELPAELITASKDVSRLNKLLLMRTNHTGSDVRIVTGDLMSNRTFPRESVQSTWWQWRPLFNVHWSVKEHINCLEARGIYLSLLWKARNLRFCNRKLFHLTDSYVAMSILAKGRTSSFALQPITRKIAAFLLGGSSHLSLAHVDSADNPTDEGSRRKTESTQEKKKRQRCAGGPQLDSEHP